MASETEEIRRKILFKVRDIGLLRIKSVTRSKTVKRYLYTRFSKKSITFIVPHYWMPYYHDGRDGFGPKDQPYLIWYVNPADDPRISRGYPLRRSDVRQLTPSDWEEGWRINNAMQRTNPEGGPMQHMIVRGYFGGTKRVGPTREHKKDPFYVKGLEEIGDVLAETAGEEITKYLKGVTRLKKGTLIIRF